MSHHHHHDHHHHDPHVKLEFTPATQGYAATPQYYPQPGYSPQQPGFTPGYQGGGCTSNFCATYLQRSTITITTITMKPRNYVVLLVLRAASLCAARLC